jgi:hypothetical protein
MLLSNSKPVPSTHSVSGLTGRLDAIVPHRGVVRFVFEFHWGLLCDPIREAGDITSTWFSLSSSIFGTFSS